MSSKYYDPAPMPADIPPLEAYADECSRCHDTSGFDGSSAENSRESYFTNFTASPEDIETQANEGVQGDSNDNGNFTRTSPPSPDEQLSPGALLFEDTNKKRHRLVASRARDILKPLLEICFAWCATSLTWHRWAGTHWGVEESSSGIDKLVHDLVAVGCDPIGFTPGYTKSITDLTKSGGSLPLPATDARGLLPFTNGLLNLSTKQIKKATQDFALTWCLPHKYSATSDCPTIKAWLSQAVGDDASMVEYLRAWLAAILTGRSDLQRFLYLYGPGSTGKSTFIRLAMALVGQINAYTSDLRNLETNRFELAGLYGKRLVVVTDAGRYGGSVDVLKALVGQDPLRLERKHQQQAGTFVFDGIVILASNEQLVTTDLTSGLDRRRAVVGFHIIVTEDEKADWKTRGGEEAVLHRELPGLVNWLLALAPDDVTRLISCPPANAARSNHDAMLANNPVARWLVECCVPDPDACTVIGQLKEIRELGQNEFAEAGQHLYPNYLAFAQGEGINQLGRGRFKETLLDAVRTLGKVVTDKRKPHDGRYAINGLRLRYPNEPLFPWVGIAGEAGEVG
jgi:putative DNA primase/helicase